MDSVDWESHRVVSNVYLPGVNLTFGNGMYLAWGDNGVLAHSVDAADWTVPTNVLDPPADYRTKTILAGNVVNLWVNEGHVSHVSTDLTTWDPVVMPVTVPLCPSGKAALFGNGWFVLRAEGRGGIHRSSDGRNWEFHSVAGMPDMLGFYQDRFLGW